MTAVEKCTLDDPDLRQRRGIDGRICFSVKRGDSPSSQPQGIIIGNNSEDPCCDITSCWFNKEHTSNR